ncbi:MAG TPA: hypothetical protein PLA94_19150 [Myxococcota bacterium]|nr:hypothetical protein [Myxococcota bacterium]HND32133.1 hypothetical protein [Myxococcota bacterium]
MGYIFEDIIQPGADIRELAADLMVTRRYLRRVLRGKQRCSTRLQRDLQELVQGVPDLRALYQRQQPG